GGRPRVGVVEVADELPAMSYAVDFDGQPGYNAFECRAHVGRGSDQEVVGYRRLHLEHASGEGDPLVAVEDVVAGRQVDRPIGVDIPGVDNGHEIASRKGVDL